MYIVCWCKSSTGLIYRCSIMVVRKSPKLRVRVQFFPPMPIIPYKLVNYWRIEKRGIERKSVTEGQWINPYLWGSSSPLERWDKMTVPSWIISSYNVWFHGAIAKVVKARVCKTFNPSSSLGSSSSIVGLLYWYSHITFFHFKFKTTEKTCIGNYIGLFVYNDIVRESEYNGTSSYECH